MTHEELHAILLNYVSKEVHVEEMKKLKSLLRKSSDNEKENDVSGPIKDKLAGFSNVQLTTAVKAVMEMNFSAETRGCSSISGQRSNMGEKTCPGPRHL